MRAVRALFTLLLALVVAGAVNAQPVRNVVLVHGALIDGSSWRGVYDILTRRGFHVSIVQQPQTGFEEDVAAVKRVLEQQDGPVVLVGHSYGGALITVAGADPKVRALVYVAALIPDVGESCTDAAAPNKEAVSHFRPTKDGYVFMAPEHFAADYGADLPKAQAEFMAHAQMPIAGSTFDVKLQAAAWREKPSFAVIATEDKALDPDRAKWMAKRANSKVTLVRASHAVLVSQAHVVARVVEGAAQ